MAEYKSYIRALLDLDVENIKEWRKGLYRLDRDHKGTWIPVLWKKKLFNIAKVDKKDIFIIYLDAHIEAGIRNHDERMVSLKGVIEDFFQYFKE